MALFCASAVYFGLLGFIGVSTLTHDTLVRMWGTQRYVLRVAELPATLQQQRVGTTQGCY
jgi:hypothetical protein